MTQSTVNQASHSRLLDSNGDSSQATSGTHNNDISEKQIKRTMMFVWYCFFMSIGLFVVSGIMFFTDKSPQAYLSLIVSLVLSIPVLVVWHRTRIEKALKSCLAG